MPCGKPWWVVSGPASGSSGAPAFFHSSTGSCYHSALAKPTLIRGLRAHSARTICAHPLEAAANQAVKRALGNRVEISGMGEVLALRSGVPNSVRKLPNKITWRELWYGSATASDWDCSASCRRRQLLNRCTVKSCTGGSNPPSPPDSLSCRENPRGRGGLSQNSRNSEGVVLEPDEREWPSLLLARNFFVFSPKWRSAVQLHNVPWANAKRSRSELARKSCRIAAIPRGLS